MPKFKHIRVVIGVMIGLAAPFSAHAFWDLFRDTQKTSDMNADPLRRCRIEKKILPAEAEDVCVNGPQPPVAIPDREVGLALADQYLAPQFASYVGDYIVKAYSTSLLLDQSFIQSYSCAATSDEAHEQLLTRIQSDLLAYGSTRESPDGIFACLERLGLVDQVKELSNAVQFSRCHSAERRARVQNAGCPVAANPNLTSDPWLDPSYEFARLAKSLSDIDLGLKALDERNAQAVADPEKTLGFAHASCPDQKYFGGCTGFLQEYAACADPEQRFKDHCIPLAVGNGDRIALMRAYQTFWDDNHARKQALEALRETIIRDHPELVVEVTASYGVRKPVWQALRDRVFPKCPNMAGTASPACHRDFRDYLELSLRLVRGQNLLYLSHEICPDPAQFTRAALVSDLDIDRRFLRDPRFSNLRPLACYDVNEEYRGDTKKKYVVETINKGATAIGIVAIIPTLGASTLEFVGAEGAAEVAGSIISKTAAARLANMSLAGAALGISHEILGAMGVLRSEEHLYTNCLGSNQRKLAADRRLAAKTRLGVIAATVVLGVMGGAEAVGAVNDARKLALISETLGAEGLAAESSAFTAIASTADDLVGVFAGPQGDTEERKPGKTPH